MFLESVVLINLTIFQILMSVQIRLIKYKMCQLITFNQNSKFSLH